MTQPRHTSPTSTHIPAAASAAPGSRAMSALRAALRFARGHAMPTVSVLAALVTCALVPPDAGYADYVDWGTLGKLACMLVAVGGMRESRLFQALAARIVAGCQGVRPLTFALVGMTALASMVVTNDMALLALLPLAAACLATAGRLDLVAPVFVLQGLAANLCGMLLPFGNPQNVYLAGAFDIGFGEFVRTMAPPFALATLLVGVACLMTGRGETSVRTEPQPVDRRLAATSLLALAACVATVVHVLPVAACLVVTVVLALVGDRGLFARTDWGLIVTFAAFFVFSGNLARVDAVQGAFSLWLAGGAFVPGALLSQVISNVPAAIVLARFTDDWAGLLAGVNVGGAGTPISSLATLIVIAQFGQVAKAEGARAEDAREQGATHPSVRSNALSSTRRFAALLVGLNVAFLAALLGAGVLLGW